MSLLSSNLFDFYFTLDDLITAINEFVDSSEYVVVKKRIKINKKRVLRKTIFRCDKSEKHEYERFEKRETFNRRCECSFKVVVILKAESNDWILKIKNDQHNHSFTLKKSHSIHRKLIMTSEIKKQINIQTLTKTVSQQIVINLRVNANEKDSMLKIKNVYNQKQRIRRDDLNNLTATQAFLQALLVRKNWFVKFISSEESLKMLFFAKISCQRMTKLNWEIFIIDCIYKINRYFMFLCIIIEVTALNIIFYIAFAFLSSEIISSFEGILQQVLELYQELNISNFIFIVTNCEISLINAISSIFSTIQHALCLWHVDKNVLKNCKRFFDDNESWKMFFDQWHKIMYVSIEMKFEKNWRILKSKYDIENHWSIVNYLKEELINRWKTRIVKCFTNKMLSFDNITTSRDEDDHFKLKRVLKSFVENLKKMITIIEMLLKNERSKYFFAHEEAKTRCSTSCSIYALKNLQIFINSHALKLIRKQFDKSLKTNNTEISLSSCTHTYQQSLRLSCAHVIEQKAQKEEMLNLENVHSHWRIYDIDQDRNKRSKNAEEFKEEKKKDEETNTEKIRIQKMQKMQKMQKILNDQKMNAKKILNDQKLNAKKSSQFSDEIASLKEFSLDSLLAINDSKKIKNKDRSSNSQNKKSDKITRRDSSDFEFTETKFNQRVNEQSERRQRERRKRERSRERERKERKRDERREEKKRERERESNQIIDDRTIEIA